MTRESDTSRTRSAPKPVSGIVRQIMGSLGLSNQYYGWLVVSQWPEIVGEHYARNSKAIRFSEGVLYVAVADASWRQMMAMDMDKIMNIIRSYPHGRVIKELRLVFGQKGT